MPFRDWSQRAKTTSTVVATLIAVVGFLTTTGLTPATRAWVTDYVTVWSAPLIAERNKLILDIQAKLDEKLMEIKRSGETTQNKIDALNMRQLEMLITIYDGRLFNYRTDLTELNLRLSTNPRDLFITKKRDELQEFIKGTDRDRQDAQCELNKLRGILSAC